MKNGFAGLALVLIVHLFSCKDKNEPIVPTLAEDSVIVGYLDSLGITYEVDGNGLYVYQIELNPTGKKQDEGKILGIYYDLRILDGPLLESYDSLDGPPRRLKQGVGAVYPVGVDMALAYPGEGEIWGYVIPSALAYVDYSSSLIPEDAILQFEVTCVSIQNEDDVFQEDTMKIKEYVDSVQLADSALYYPYNNPRLLSSGMVFHQRTGGSGLQPSAGNEVTITYSAYFPYQESTPFDVAHNSNASSFTYDFNQLVVITGLDLGVAEMREGMRSVLIMPSYLGYRESVRVLPQYNVLIQDLIDLEVIPTYAAKVGPYEILIFDVRLLDVQ